MNKNTLWKGVISFGLLFGVSQGCDDAAQNEIISHESVVLNVYQEGPSFTVMLDNGDKDQIVRSRGTLMGPIEIIFPAGSLDKPTSISVSKFDGIPEYLVSTSINESVTPVSTGSSIEIEPRYEQNPEKPITVSLPAPSIVTINQVYPAVMYSTFDYDSDQFTMGLIQGEDIIVGDGVFTFDTSFFGVFQAIFLSDGILSAENSIKGVKSLNGDIGNIEADLNQDSLMCSELHPYHVSMGYADSLALHKALQLSEDPLDYDASHYTAETDDQLFEKDDLNLLSYDE
jgi:hypothetical protein